MGSPTAYAQLRDRLLGELRDENALELELPGLSKLLYGDAETWSLYSRSAPQLREAGFRLLGRSMLEAIVDSHCRLVVDMVQQAIEGRRLENPLRVLDLFAGSGNLLHHLACALAIPGRGADTNAQIVEAANHNLRLAGGSDVRIEPINYTELLTDVTSSLILVDLPWGTAFDPPWLDLRATVPPVPTLIAELRAAVGSNSAAVVLKTNDCLTEPIEETLIGSGFAVIDNVISSGMGPGYNACYWLLLVEPTPRTQDGCDRGTNDN